MAKIKYTANDPRTLTGTMARAIDNEEFWKSNRSTVALGEGMLLDISKAPHVLVAGTTGSGKSVMLHNIIASLMMKNSPDTAKLLIIDPKMVEFKYFYQNHPLLWSDIVTDPADAMTALERASDEMMVRYAIMSEEGMRFWTGGRLYIIIDEIADLIDTCGKRVEKVIANIARLGRGAGVHLIVATQHPTAQVLSRQITANIDTRIALRTDDSTASRLIIREAGAEKLKGRGDALIRQEGHTRHFQGAYINDHELEVFAKSYSLERSTDNGLHWNNMRPEETIYEGTSGKEEKKGFKQRFREMFL